jgi:hypothetical protein
MMTYMCVPNITTSNNRRHIHKNYTHYNRNYTELNKSGEEIIPCGGTYRQRNDVSIHTI